MQEVKQSVVKYHEFEDRNLFLLLAFLAFSACRDSKKNVDFSLEKSSSSNRVSTETLMKELKHLVFEKRVVSTFSKMGTIDDIYFEKFGGKYVSFF